MITKHFINLNQHAMKNLTLKVAVIAVAMFAGFGAFAQNNKGLTAAGGGGWIDYQTIGKYNRSASDTTVFYDYTAVTYNDSITVGKTMPFFVWPSAAYNPTWNPGLVFANVNYPNQVELETGVVSDFQWKGGASYATLANLGGLIKNYVEIALPAAAGNYMIQVTETPKSGVCSGRPVYFGVKTVIAPSASFTLSTTPTLYGLDSILVSACGGNAALTTAVGAISDDANPFHVNLGFKVYNVSALDGSGNIDLLTATDITNVMVGAAYPNRIVKGVDGVLTPSATNPIVVPTKATPIIASQAYDVRNAMITVYEFTFHGLSGKISRKSDYLAARAGNWTATDYANFSYYDVATPTTGEKYYIVAFPKPVTGPIYHIANTFAY